MTNSGKKLPIGVQSFEKIIEDRYLYADKTKYIYDLVHGGSQYFLSRPRRFGKSLLLSTLSAYWEGKKALFAGLAIEELEKDNEEAWAKYPVFYFDFNRDDLSAENSLEGVLDEHLKSWEKIYGMENPDSTLAGRFSHLVERAYAQTGHRCVVLVDEYDKPLLETIDDVAHNEHNKSVFKGFFSVLKSFDKYIQFAFITGVTKFSKVSIFSDLNQLEDISLSRQFSGICGITEKEIEDNFGTEIDMLSEDYGVSRDVCIDRLRKMYDGYHFSKKGEGVYNPFSLINAFKKLDFGAYWFETGTPTFLVKKLKTMRYDVRNFSDESLQATENRIFDYRVESDDIIPLLYQTGYLTIDGYDDRKGVYTLAFPNDEVKYAFLDSLMNEYTQAGRLRKDKTA